MRHWRLSSLLILGLVAALLAGCGGGGGGGSASITGPTGSGGGSSTAVIQGQVTSRRTAAQEPVIVIVLETALGIGRAEAQDESPVAGAIVSLKDSSGTTIKTATTDSEGKFVFENVAPGVYTLTVEINGVTVGDPVSVVVGAGDNATVTGQVTPQGLVAAVKVEVADNAITENPAQLGHAINLANAAKIDVTEVIDLRLQGLGWGEIAKLLGVDPGLLGLGRSNVSDAAIESASAKAKGKGKGKGKKS